MEVENYMPYDKAYNQVIDYIKKGIMDKTYQLGDKLPSERELSEKLGISRNSVREALRVLGIMGVIAPHHGAGNYVSDNFENSIIEIMSMMYALDKIDNEQISEYRHAMEVRSFILALKYITYSEIQEMKTFLQGIDECSSEEERTQLDKKFHYALVKASRNAIFIQNVDALNQIMDIFIRDMRYAIMMTPEGEQKLRRTHWRIVEALEEKNEQKGIAALDDHFMFIKQSFY